MNSTLSILLGVIAVLLLLWQVVRDSGNARLKKRAANLQKRKTSPKKTAESELSLRRKANEPKSALLRVLLKPLPDFQKLQDRLDAAGSKKTAKQFMFRSLVIMGLCIGVAGMMHKNLMIGFFVGVLLGVWLPLKILNFRINRKMKKFLTYFPDALDLIVRGLRSGLPVSESINLVSQEVPEPVGGIFGHVSSTMKLGVPMEKALMEMAKKLHSTEFNFFVTTIILQRETGGNLSEILNNLAEVLRSRLMMRMKIHAMTSEARASSMIIGAMPFIVIGAVLFTSPDYMVPMIEDRRGNIGLAIAIGMLSFGMWLMRRMARFQI